MSGNWRFLDSGPGSPQRNMELDEGLARGLLLGEHGPTLRVYTWSPWAISLGRHQDPGEIDADACRADGIRVVVRPTGGRAILHAEELTYSVVLPARGRTILQVYQAIGEALQAALRRFGVDATLERSQADFSRLYRSPASIPCFSSSARYEVSWRGKKLVGSAQRRYGGGDETVVLQHGSILCGPAHQNLVNYLLLSDAALRPRMAADLAARTISLSEVTGEAVDIGRLAECVRYGFEQAMQPDEDSVISTGIRNGTE